MVKLRVLAKRVGKSVPTVLLFQKKFGLPVYKDYSKGYMILLKKLIFLSICSVPDREVKSLLEKEKKLLELLKVDSLFDKEHWFESFCLMESGPTRLLFSGYDLGHPVDCEIVQPSLDFSEREKELFQSSEMGASALRELRRYSELHQKIQARIRQELPIVGNALTWARRI